MTAAYALAAGEWLPYIFGAPEFVNDAFVQQFREGLPPVTPRPVPGFRPITWSSRLLKKPLRWWREASGGAEAAPRRCGRCS